MNGVSVIVPAFNAEKTLPDTLRSLFAQTLPPDEIIVIDDGSTDDTARVAAAAPGVRVVRQPNEGTGGALNAGLRLANRPLIAFLDADDVWTPRCLEFHLSNLEKKTSLDASVGWVSEFVCPSLSPEDAARFRPRAAQPGWLSGATLVRNRCIGRAGEFDPALRGAAWIDWMRRARRAGLDFGVIDEITLQRRLHPDSWSIRAAADGYPSLLHMVKSALACRHGNNA